jgi:hypothetical protein
MGIDGCPTDAGKEEAVAYYCKGLEMGLKMWKVRLHDIFASDKRSGSKKLDQSLK